MVEDARYDISVELRLRVVRESGPILQLMPRRLAEELVAELNAMEGILTESNWIPYMMRRFWPDEPWDGEYPPRPEFMMTPEWIVYIGLALNVIILPANTAAATAAYIGAIERVRTWWRERRNRDDVRDAEVTLRIKSKHGELDVELDVLSSDELAVHIEATLRERPAEARQGRKKRKK